MTTPPAGPFRVGLTGGIGTGKSAVADLLAARGAVIIDADVLAREAVAPGTPGLAAIATRFGPSVIAADGTLDRPTLGRLVFEDETARQALNAIVHPRVRQMADALEATAPAGAVADVVLDNSGTAEALAGQVDGLWRRLRRGAAGRGPFGDAPDPGDAG